MKREHEVEQLLKLQRERSDSLERAHASLLNQFHEHLKKDQPGTQQSTLGFFGRDKPVDGDPGDLKHHPQYV